MNKNLYFNYTSKFPLDYFRMTKVVSFCDINIAAFNIYMALLPYSLKEHFGALNIEEYLDELYGTNISLSYSQYGDKIVVSYFSTSLNEDYVPSMVFSEAVRLMHSYADEDIIIDTNLMEIRKQELIKKSKDRFKKPYSIAKIKAFSQLEKENAFNYDLLGKEEDIRAVSEGDLYKIHDLLRKKGYSVFFQGKKNEYKDDVIKKFFPCPEETGPFDFLPMADLSLPVHNEENNDALNSTICALYHYKMDYSFHNLIVIRLASDILGGDCSLFFSHIREKEGLCYSIEASPAISQKVIIITSSTKKSSLERMYKSIDDIICNFDKYVSEENLKISKMNLVSEKYLKIDDGNFLFASNSATLVKRGTIYSVEDELKEISSVTLDEIKNFVKELHLVSSYSVIGGK